METSVISIGDQVTGTTHVGLLPTFMTGDHATFQLEVSENKKLSAIQVHRLLKMKQASQHNRWQVNTWKDTRHHMSLRKCKLNASKTIMRCHYVAIQGAKIQNTKCWWGWRQEPHSLLEELQIGTATSGDGLTASYRTKHTLTIWPTSHRGSLVFAQRSWKLLSIQRPAQGCLQQLYS